MSKTKDIIKKAVALEFDKAIDHAPRVTAKGEGFVAEQLIEIAKEHDIEIHKDATLVDILSALELNQHIPLESYMAVAEILSYIYDKDKKAGMQNTNDPNTN